MTVERVRPLDALKTYRYLRIGMIGAVVLLGASIVIEFLHAENNVTHARWCLQTSISAYYFTPVRAIFVGTMFLIGLSLIVYKGRGVLEDSLLNIAGMLAPVVAVVPTTDIGDCWSIEPNPKPLNSDGSLANWVVKNIDNNVNTLIFVGFVAVAVGFVIWRLNRRTEERRSEIQPHTPELLMGMVAVLSLAALLKHFKRDLFLANAHGKSAVLLFLFLWLAILANVRAHADEPAKWRNAYLLVAVSMVIGVGVSFLFGRHQILVLEAWEIVAFAVYWLLQTVENWDEKVIVRRTDPRARLTES